MLRPRLAPLLSNNLTALLFFFVLPRVGRSSALPESLEVRLNPLQSRICMQPYLPLNVPIERILKTARTKSSQLQYFPRHRHGPKARKYPLLREVAVVFVSKLWIHGAGRKGSASLVQLR